MSHAVDGSQDGWVMVESSDKLWSTGEGNGKPLQYSCLKNPMNNMKRILECVAISFFRESSQPRDQTWLLNCRRIQGNPKLQLLSKKIDQNYVSFYFLMDQLVLIHYLTWTSGSGYLLLMTFVSLTYVLVWDAITNTKDLAT